MPEITLQIPARFVGWFRGQVAEEVSCDIDASAPDSKKLSRFDLEETAAIAERATGIFDQLGYPEDAGETDRAVTLGGPYAAYLIRGGLRALGEDMQTAVGEHEGHEFDPAKIRELTERGAWLSALRDQLGDDIEPSRAVRVGAEEEEVASVMGEPETRGSIEITAEERNELWDLAEFAFNGAAEGLVGEGGVDSNRATELGIWLGGLQVIGYERKAGTGCSIPLNLPFIFLVEGAEKQAVEILDDSSKTMAEKFRGMTAAAIEELFLPPAEDDREGGYIVGYCRVKAIRERMEAAEPGLRKGGES